MDRNRYYEDNHDYPGIVLVRRSGHYYNDLEEYDDHDLHIQPAIKNMELQKIWRIRRNEVSHSMKRPLTDEIIEILDSVVFYDIMLTGDFHPRTIFDRFSSKSLSFLPHIKPRDRELLLRTESIFTELKDNIKEIKDRLSTLEKKFKDSQPIEEDYDTMDSLLKEFEDIDDEYLEVEDNLTAESLLSNMGVNWEDE